MKTSTEWLFEKLFEEREDGQLLYQLEEDIVGLFEKAKEMEKEQIIDAYRTAEDNCEWLIEEHKWQRFHAEDYYNENYGK